MIFTKEEYASRLTKTKQRMSDAGYDLLICQDPANMGWLTGFDGWSFYVPQAVLVHINDDQPIWFGRAQDAKAATLTTWMAAGTTAGMSSENIIGYSEHLIHHPQAHPFDELGELISNRGWATHRIGVEFDAHYYTARCHDHLVKALPRAQFSDCHELVNWARLVKSEQELIYMREAGEICTATMNKAFSRIEPGIPQYEVIADVYHAQVSGVNGKFGDYTSLCPLIQVGEGTSTPHLTWTDQPIPDDALIVMELGAARHHYHAPLTRTIHVGKPPSIVTDLTDVIIEGVDAALATAKPGVTCEDVEAVWQKVLNRNGYKKESRVGYSIGLNYPPDWGERTASLRPGDKTELEVGMCFHFQSGVWLEKFGAAISEPFIVTENGGERLCDVYRGLMVVD